MSTALPQRLGDFEIVRELGRGGMGIVYEARQLSLKRKVALKVLSGSLGLTPKAVQRFRREAEAAAKLHHTNIVPVYATGEQEGTHFYAMELIDGPSLDRVLRQLRQTQSAQPAKPPPAPPQPSTVDEAPPGEALPPWVEQSFAPAPSARAPAATASQSSSDLGSGSGYFDAVARMLAEVADALDYAHSQGVIHRDIKPSNLLLSPAGRLSVNDFGLARMLEQPGMTLTGEFVGTPKYMSPEQVAAGRIPLDHRTDIYSLGATLYELLTLRPPFSGGSRDQVLAQILQKDPRPPRKLNKKVPVDLETICLKALDKDPDRRYPTAGAMAEDLRRYVNRFAIAARRAGPVERLKKWVRRHPGLAATLGCLLVALMAAGFFASESWRQERARVQAEAEARQKLQEEKKKRAEEQVRQGDFAAAEEAIREAVALGAAPEWADWRRGQIAYHRFEPEKAVEHLERAVPKLPGNVAARALLSLAYIFTDSGKYFQMSEELEALTPVEAEDFLYKGYVQMYLNPTEGLRTLDEAMRRQSSLIAHMVRAIVRFDQAMHTSDVRLAEEAIQDAEAAKTILRDNAFALGVSVQAYQVAAALYLPEEADKRKAVLAKGWQDAKELARFPDLPLAAWSRGMFLEAHAPDDEALRHWQEAVRQPEVSPIVAEYYARALYRRGEVASALDFANARLRLWYTRAYFLAEFRDRHDEAVDAFREYLRPLPAWQAPAEYARFLLLLGRKAEAIAHMREARPQLDRAPSFVRDLVVTVGAFLTDPNPEAARKYLQAVGRSRRDQAEAHFLIGLVRLADGDRDGAREQFEAAVATHCYYFDSYNWSRAYLARMKQDRDWPRWLPVKP